MGKTLIVFYSAQKHTKNVATKIAKKLDADIFEILPEQVYTENDLSWTNPDSRVSREHDDIELRNVPLASTKAPNWSSYDTVILGYPIWWGIAAWPVESFVKSVNWQGKTVIPFCTSHSSSIGESDELLKAKSNGGGWEEGKRFYQGATDEDIQKWLDDLQS